MFEDKTEKSKLSLQEEEILAYWRENDIFRKTLEKNIGKEEFVFFEGPPTANGRPGIHHMEARAFKDAIPRFMTMRGFHVRRKGGWDTHGLPVELQVEKELGLKSKKEIENYGVAGFNDKCKESVWKYVHEWEQFTERIAYWVDLKDPYITYKTSYIESLWHIVKKVHQDGLLYKDYKVVPWCPRCGTGLSSHELAQGYQDVKDLSVYVKFKVEGEKNLFMLAWTTTPWTLPGNVALAVGKDIEYVRVEIEETGENYILARERLSVLKDKKYKEIRSYQGSELAGLKYEPLYPFIKKNIKGFEKEKLQKAYSTYLADFVTTADGTGIVHTAVMYGQDDFELGTKVGLPKYHLVRDDGTFTDETEFLAGMFVKAEETDVAIIKDLSGKGLLFSKEKYQHSYPFCWRCKTPLIYFARDSWYIRMSALRDKLVKENEKIHWEPDYIKDGRFGEWLKEIKDWAISRERYWGTPLPVWKCEKCSDIKVVGSVDELDASVSENKYFLVRHGQSENNVADTLNGDISIKYGLTVLGKTEAKEAGTKLRGEKIDLIFASPFVRTKETAEIIADSIGYPKDKIVYEDRIVEMSFGEVEGIKYDEFCRLYEHREDYFTQSHKGIEPRLSIKKRVGDFLRELESKYKGKRILIVSHEAPLWMMESAASGLDIKQSLAIKPREKGYIRNAEIKEIVWKDLPRNTDYELDLHRPYIDEVKFECDCGGEMSRVKEVMDVWFDSGAMPFAQDHYPFENKDRIDGGFLKKAKGYPADFISEAIDQTRGWFYTMHAIGILMGKGHAYKNVVCLGHILDAQGKKMSKSVGNVVDPNLMISKYGADPLRFWMYSINQPGESKNFDEKTVDEVVKKVYNLASNVLSFYKLYGSDIVESSTSDNILDRWIISRLNSLTEEVTQNLDKYLLLEPTRALRDFIADLSQWYLRRSRDRIKGEDTKDRNSSLATTREVLLTLSKLMAPFAPFFAEHLYKEAGGSLLSVHLEDWPVAGKIDKKLLDEMQKTRDVVSKALEARSKSNIKVRQPLKELKLKKGSFLLPEDLLNVIRDEVNVKSVVYDDIEGEIFLDAEITPELKKEGDLRETIRRIQEMRKEKGLKPGESAVLMTSPSVEESGILREFEEEIKKTASLSRIDHGKSESEEMILI